MPHCQSGPLEASRNRRVKTCADHQRASSVEMSGDYYRFCQRCVVFHPTSKFREEQHSCREKLEQHNSRRRQRRREMREKGGTLQDSQKPRVEGSHPSPAHSHWPSASAMGNPSGAEAMLASINQMGIGGGSGNEQAFFPFHSDIGFPQPQPHPPQPNQNPSPRAGAGPPPNFMHLGPAASPFFPLGYGHASSSALDGQGDEPRRKAPRFSPGVSAPPDPYPLLCRDDVLSRVLDPCPTSRYACPFSLRSEFLAWSCPDGCPNRGLP